MLIFTLEKYTVTAMNYYFMFAHKNYCCTITPIYKALRAFASFKAITYNNENTKIQDNFLYAHVFFFVNNNINFSFGSKVNRTNRVLTKELDQITGFPSLQISNDHLPVAKL